MSSVRQPTAGWEPWVWSTDVDAVFAVSADSYAVDTVTVTHYTDVTGRGVQMLSKSTGAGLRATLTDPTLGVWQVRGWALPRTVADSADMSVQSLAFEVLSAGTDPTLTETIFARWSQASEEQQTAQYLATGWKTPPVAPENRTERYGAETVFWDLWEILDAVRDEADLAEVTRRIPGMTVTSTRTAGGDMAHPVFATGFWSGRPFLFHVKDQLATLVVLKEPAAALPPTSDIKQWPDSWSVQGQVSREGHRQLYRPDLSLPTMADILCALAEGLTPQVAGTEACEVRVDE